MQREPSCCRTKNEEEVNTKLFGRAQKLIRFYPRIIIIASSAATGKSATSLFYRLGVGARKSSMLSIASDKCCVKPALESFVP